MHKGYTRLLLLVTLCFSSFVYASDPLPSWNDGAIKKNIIHFVNATTNTSSKDYVTPEDRIATIDNDGTLWLEQPLYTQFIFMISRFEMLAKQHPEWQQQAPYQSIMAKLKNQGQDITRQDLTTIFAVTSANVSTDAYNNMAKDWLAKNKNPRFKRLYTQLTYQPMQEVIHYLHANNFQVYIVSGGGQAFVRSFATDTYHIQPNHVIGSTTKTQYRNPNNAPTLMKTDQILFISDHTGKPEAIDLFIGKKPIIAFGNSDGDREMLEWTQSNKAKHLMLLVHHDDAEREYAYDTQSKVGTFSESLMTEAKKNDWQVISMKNDWKVIFPVERK